jgi:hypothetical protein
MAINPFGYYTWKLCPYSTAYKTLFYDEGYRGSSVNPLLQGTTWTPLTTADHLVTAGRMKMKYSLGSGWICDDPDCPFYTDTGYYYIEN